MITITARDVLDKLFDLEKNIDDLKTEVIRMRIEISDMTNGHGVAFGNLQDKYDSLIRKLNTGGK